MRKMDQTIGAVNFRAAVALAAMLVMGSPAYAQFEKGTQALTKFNGWFVSIGLLLVTLAIMWVGSRMIFNAAQWKDVSHVFWGGVLLGGASTFASLFF